MLIVAYRYPRKGGIVGLEEEEKANEERNSEKGRYERDEGEVTVSCVAELVVGSLNKAVQYTT